MADTGITARTKVGNEEAIRQFVSTDSCRVLSIIKSGSSFRFVEDYLIFESATDAVAAHSFWQEAQRSGVYETAADAEAAAIASTEWLKAHRSS